MPVVQRFDCLVTDTKNITKDIAAVRESVENLNAGLAKVASQPDTVTNQIQDLSKEVAEVSTNITQITANIKKLSEDYETVSSDTDKVTENMTKFSQDMDLMSVELIEAKKSSMAILEKVQELTDNNGESMKLVLLMY